MIKKFGFVLFLSVLLLSSASFVFAQNTVGDVTSGPPSSGGVIDLGDLNPLGSSCKDMECVLGKLLSLAATVAMIITPFIVMYGAYQILTAAGKPEKVKDGGKTILYAMIGFIIAFVAKDIAKLLLNVVSGGSP